MTYIGDGDKLEHHYPGEKLRIPTERHLLRIRNKLGNDGFYIRNHYYCDDISEHPLVSNLMPFYKRVLCVTLQKAVEDNLSAPVTSQLSLLEELALTREIACEPLAEYSDIVTKIEKISGMLEDPETSEEDKQTLLKALDLSKKLKENNGAKAVAALSVVKEFCEKAARIDALSRDKFSIHTLNSVVAQITNIISKKLHDNKLDHIAVEVEEAIRNDLVMPLPETASSSNNGNLGINLTPEMVLRDVTEMDDMVPSS